MRVEKLVLQAFGPYAGRQTIDFAALGDHRLFLIAGPTGAGKSSILDAICFALYGETSGDERKPPQMRSDHAAPDVPTEVILDFAVGAERYRILRRPDQSLAGKGGRIREEKHAATLWRRDPARPEAEGEVLATRVREVAARVEAILGFSAPEFRQVVMLPQEQFRRLISAGSADRQKVLQTLFQTVLYRRIETALKERAGDTHKAMDRLRAHEAGLLASANVESRDHLQARLDAAAAALAQARGRLEELRTAEADRRTALEAGRRAQETLTRLEQAKAALAGFAERAAVQEERRASIADARRALHVRPAEAALREAVERQQRALERQAQAEAAERAAAAARDTAAAARAREEAREAERDAARRALHGLEALGERVAALAAARAAETEAAARAAAARAADAAAQEKLAASAAALEQAQRRQEENRALADRAELLADRAKAAAERLRRRKLLTAAQAQAEGLAGELARLRAGREDAAARRARTARDLEEAEEAWLRDQAHALAGRLAAGEPCPVCGSPDHPAPAQAGTGAGDRGRVESLRGELRRQDAALQAAGEALARAESNLDAHRRQCAELAEALGEDAGRPAEALAAAAGEAARQRDAAQAAPPRPADEAAALERARSARLAAEEAARAAAETANRLAAAHGSAAAVLAERAAAVPEALRAPDALARAVAAARAALAALETALETARKQAETANAGHAAAERALADARRALQEASEERAAREQAFAAALAEQAFRDEAAYRAAWMEPRALEDVERHVREFDEGRSSAEARLRDCEREAAGLTPPDLPALEAALAAAAQAVEEQNALVVRTQEEIKRDRDCLGQLDRLAQDFAALDRRYRTEGRLAEVAAGSNGRKLSFERYVLGAFLDDVAGAANARLRIMSRGRYELRRLDEGADGRKAAGLDLEVLDGYTGKARPVATLSGGEGFVAALSLALGVTDVVQAYAGGVSIETLFIDEGFGSLDPEALDAAVQALIDLQAAGRLVGVISHVGDLRERLPARLEVTAGRSGSAARFVV